MPSPKSNFGVINTECDEVTTRSKSPAATHTRMQLLTSTLTQTLTAMVKTPGHESVVVCLRLNLSTNPTLTLTSTLVQVGLAKTGHKMSVST